MAACVQQAFTPAVIEKEEKVYIDQDLHVYRQRCDLFYCVFLFGVELLFNRLSTAPRNLIQIFL